MGNPSGHDPYQALRFSDFRLLLVGNLFNVLGGQMLSLTIGWELYDRTDSALVLGMVGLVLVIPIILFTLPAGQIADQFNRKKVVIVSQVVLATGSVLLAALSYWQGPITLIYGCLLLIGTGTAFSSPASKTLPVEVVPENAFENSVTWSSSTIQLAMVLGPALGGLVVGLTHSPMLVYLLNCGSALAFITLLMFVKGGQGGAQDNGRRREKPTIRILGEGARFLRQTPIILAAITLDLFAVLFGGATTLLPIYARDILGVGPEGLGWLRAAPSIGAVCMAMYLAHRPPLQKAGHTMLLAVAGFGIATVVFGVSHYFWLSTIMLLVLGGMDNISVVVRSTLLLTRTPNEMRGRVQAINALFISTSNQLGGFESGLTAQLFGPIISVVGGGIATVLVVIAVAAVWPELRQMRTLRES